MVDKPQVGRVSLVLCHDDVAWILGIAIVPIAKFVAVEWCGRNLNRVESGIGAAAGSGPPQLVVGKNSDGVFVFVFRKAYAAE